MCCGLPFINLSNVGIICSVQCQLSFSQMLKFDLKIFNKMTQIQNDEMCHYQQSVSQNNETN